MPPKKAEACTMQTLLRGYANREWSSDVQSGTKAIEICI
jgi:hypothetical protein